MTGLSRTGSSSQEEAAQLVTKVVRSTADAWPFAVMSFDLNSGGFNAGVLSRRDWYHFTVLSWCDGVSQSFLVRFVFKTLANSE